MLFGGLFEKIMYTLLLGGLLVFLASEKVAGHGMLVDPPNRSSLWRIDSSFPVNWDDNQNFCGGFAVQYYENDGNCGVCGDNYADPRPRKNENTGQYGTGAKVAIYEAGSVINVGVNLTANHRGTFTFSICKLEDSFAPEPEDCFQDLKFADGSDTFTIQSDHFVVSNQLILPEGLTCEHCVLRWNYRTGNSWGICEDGTGATGCGPQENFRSCSDITIV